MMTTEDKIRVDIQQAVRRHRGALTEIANKTSMCREFVRLVLNGKRNNLEVLRVAAEVVEARELIRSEIITSAKRTMDRVADMAMAF